MYGTTRTCLPRYVSKSDLDDYHHLVKKRDKIEKKILLLYLCTVWSEPLLFDSLIVDNRLVSTKDFWHLSHPPTATAQISLRIIMRSLARTFAVRIHNVMKVQSKFIPLARLNMHF